MENEETNDQEPWVHITEGGHNIWMPMEELEKLRDLGKELCEKRMKRIIDAIWMDFKEEKVNEENPTKEVRDPKKDPI